MIVQVHYMLGAQDVHNNNYCTHKEEIATVAPNNNERNRVPPNTSQGSALLSARQYFVSCTTFPQWYNCKWQDFLNRIIIEGRNLDASLRTRN